MSILLLPNITLLKFVYQLFQPVIKYHFAIIMIDLTGRENKIMKILMTFLMLKFYLIE